MCFVKGGKARDFFPEHRSSWVLCWKSQLKEQAELHVISSWEVWAQTGQLLDVPHIFVLKALPRRTLAPDASEPLLIKQPWTLPPPASPVSQLRSYKCFQKSASNGCVSLCTSPRYRQIWHLLQFVLDFFLRPESLIPHFCVINDIFFDNLSLKLRIKIRTCIRS